MKSVPEFEKEILEMRRWLLVIKILKLKKKMEELKFKSLSYKTKQPEEAN